MNQKKINMNTIEVDEFAFDLILEKLDRMETRIRWLEKVSEAKRLGYTRELSND